MVPVIEVAKATDAACRLFEAYPQTEHSPTNMSTLEAIFVQVEGDAYHAVVEQLARAARLRPSLRALELAEFSPPHPWLKLAVPQDEIAARAREISQDLGVLVIGLAVQTVVDAFAFRLLDSGEFRRVLVYGFEGDEERQWSPDRHRKEGSPEPWESGVDGEHLDSGTAADAVFRHYDLPRFSDHRLRIGPAWPFRRWEWFW